MNLMERTWRRACTIMTWSSAKITPVAMDGCIYWGEFSFVVSPHSKNLDCFYLLYKPGRQACAVYWSFWSRLRWGLRQAFRNEGDSEKDWLPATLIAAQSLVLDLPIPAFWHPSVLAWYTQASILPFQLIWQTFNRLFHPSYNRLPHPWDWKQVKCLLNSSPIIFRHQYSTWPFSFNVDWLVFFRGFIDQTINILSCLCGCNRFHVIQIYNKRTTLCTLFQLTNADS